MKYSGLVAELCNSTKISENNKLKETLFHTGNYISAGKVSSLNPPMPCNLVVDKECTLIVFDLVCGKEFEIKREFYFPNPNGCLDCGYAMQVNPTRVLTSMPPQNCYYCPKCDTSTHKIVEEFKLLNK